MPITNICRSIKCPYFGEKGKNYGCQRYALSCHCHLCQVIPQVGSSEYILYAQKNQSIDINALQRENNRFFLEDEKYGDDISFQKTRSSWFTEDSFQVAEIKQ